MAASLLWVPQDRGPRDSQMQVAGGHGEILHMFFSPAWPKTGSLIGVFIYLGKLGFCLCLLEHVSNM